MDTTFDLIVIGAGPAGYHAAALAAENGLKTAILSNNYLGGVCLNEGCIPTKALLNSAKMFHYIETGDKYGITAENAALAHDKVVARKNKVTKVLIAGVAAKLRQSGATVLNEAASAITKDGDLFTVTGAADSYTAKKILLATGSRPFVPPIEGMKEAIDAGFAITSKEILTLTEVPQTLTVIGGGVIGLEMAAYFAAAGSKVSVVEMLPSIGGPLDTDICAVLTKNLKKQGIAIHTSCAVTRIGTTSIFYKDADGSEQECPSDKVLVCVGRRAYTGDFAASLGLACERGAVVTDETMQTSVPGVYAAGDVNGKSMLAHTAYREAEVAVHNMLGQPDTMTYNAVPAVIYTNPEVAFVGVTGQAAQDADCKIVTLPLRQSGRYVAEVEGGDGICKLIADAKTGTLIGAHIIGSYASEMIFALAMVIQLKTPISELCKVIFPHPTVGEVVRDGFFALLK